MDDFAKKVGRVILVEGECLWTLFHVDSFAAFCKFACGLYY